MEKESQRAPVWRHEYKYTIDACKAALIRGRIEGLAEKDAHAGADGAYEIRSVYFDDYADTCYRQNQAGTDPRCKYRIRCYNGQDSFVRLEKKSKRNGMTAKESCLLSGKQALELIRGEGFGGSAKELAETDGLLREFILLQKTRGLRARVLVVYNRIPYLYETGNVRITLDSGLCAGTRPEEIFAENPFLKPVFSDRQMLLEVKYDALLPSVLRENLQIRGLSQETFSKYYLCRREEKKIHEYLW